MKDVYEIIAAGLTDPDESVTVASIRAVNSADLDASPEIARNLDGCLNAVSEAVVAATLEKLAEVPRCPTIQAWERTLESLVAYSWQVKEAVRNLIRRHGLTAAIPTLLADALVQQISDPSGFLAANTYAELGFPLENAAFVESLWRVLNEQLKSEDRSWAGKLLHKAGVNRLRDATRELLLQRFRSGEQELKQNSLGVLADFCDDADTIAALTESDFLALTLLWESHEIRQSSAILLQATGRRAAIPAVVSALVEHCRSKNKNSQREAGSLLREFGERAAIAKVYKYWLSRLLEADLAVRVESLRVLGRNTFWKDAGVPEPIAEVVAAFVSLLTAKDREIKIAAWPLLSNWGNATQQAILTRLQALNVLGPRSPFLKFFDHLE